MSIHDITVKIFRQACAQDLAVWMQQHGWLLSVLAFNDRLVWIQATKGGQRIEAEVRGLPDLSNACKVLMNEVIRVDEKVAKAAA